MLIGDGTCRMRPSLAMNVSAPSRTQPEMKFHARNPTSTLGSSERTGVLSSAEYSTPSPMAITAIDTVIQNGPSVERR